jgi:hypothetical protein
MSAAEGTSDGFTSASMAAFDPMRLSPEFSLCIAPTTRPARSGPEQVQQRRSRQRRLRSKRASWSTLSNRFTQLCEPVRSAPNSGRETFVCRLSPPGQWVSDVSTLAGLADRRLVGRKAEILVADRSKANLPCLIRRRPPQNEMTCYIAMHHAPRG